MCGMNPCATLCTSLKPGGFPQLPASYANTVIGRNHNALLTLSCLVCRYPSCEWKGKLGRGTSIFCRVVGIHLLPFPLTVGVFEDNRIQHCQAPINIHHPHNNP